MKKIKPRYQIEPIQDHLAFQEPDYSDSARRPLRVYLELDIRDGSLGIRYVQNSDNSVPMSVWNGLVQRFPLRNDLDPVELTKAINDGQFDDILGQIQNLFEEVWDGSNYVGKLRNEADDVELMRLEKKLEEMLDDFVAYNIEGIWEAEEWLYHSDLIKEYGLTASTTDEQLEEIAKTIEDDARGENVVLVYTWEHLVNVREKLQEQEGDEE